MQPTTRGRYRVHDRRAGDDEAAEFVLVELPGEPVAPDDPRAADAYEPVYVAAEGYDGALADDVDALEPGYVVDAALAWADGTARFTEVTVRNRSRFYFADDVTGMFEAAVDAWQDARPAGEALTSQVTRSTDGEPNGALYLFADAPGRDLFAEIRSGRVPIEPLVARVNTQRGAAERAVFVLRPADYQFVAVYVVFEADGVLANTVRDTYDVGAGLAGGLDAVDGDPSSPAGEKPSNATDEDQSDTVDEDPPGAADVAEVTSFEDRDLDVDADDRLRDH